MIMLDRDFHIIQKLTETPHSAISVETPGGETLNLQGLNKIFWPRPLSRDAYLKKDALLYYAQTGEQLLPFLAEQPQMPQRYPDGVEGGYFQTRFQANHMPAFVKALTTESWHNLAVMLSNTEGLLYLTNLGCIEYEMSAHNVLAWQILIPDNEPFEIACRIAKTLLVHIEEYAPGLLSHVYCKTIYKNNSWGLDILIPIIGPVDRLKIARRIADKTILEWEHLKLNQDPHLAQTGWMLSITSNHVGIPVPGSPLTAPYSLYPNRNALVSAPVSLDEVMREAIDPREFNLGTMHQRLEDGGNLWANFYENTYRFADNVVPLKKRKKK